MKKYILDEIEKTRLNMAHEFDHQKSINAQMACDNLEVIYNYLYGKDEDSLDNIQLMQNGALHIDNSYFNFIKRIIRMYSELPLLETECNIEYPILNSKKSTDGEILAFMNNLYTKEGVSYKFNRSNVKIFKPSLTRKLTFKSGECIIYINEFSKERNLIMEKYNTIQDLIQPSAKGIQLITGTLDVSTDLYQHFIAERATKEAIDILGTSEGKKMLLLNNDTTILQARRLLLYLTKMNSDIDKIKWEDLNDNLRAKILHFINKVLGSSLASNDELSLDLLLDSEIYEDGKINLGNVDSSYDDITRVVKEKTKYLKSRGI